ncbi:hypothetical protein ACPZ19_24165 [Amycolatopsis lurida]
MTANPETEGPPIVTGGDPGHPTILVFDPDGLAKHGDLPATWRPLSEHRRIVWCRVPSDGALTEGAELLTGDGLTRPVHVVAGGVAVTPVRRLLDENPAEVTLLLVDPPPGEDTDGDVIVRGDGGPFPLGHPDVVAAVERSLR